MHDAGMQPATDAQVNEAYVAAVNRTPLLLVVPPEEALLVASVTPAAGQLQLLEASQAAYRALARARARICLAVVCNASIGRWAAG